MIFDFITAFILSLLVLSLLKAIKRFYKWLDDPDRVRVATNYEVNEEVRQRILNDYRTRHKYDLEEVTRVVSKDEERMRYIFGSTSASKRHKTKQDEMQALFQARLKKFDEGKRATQAVKALASAFDGIGAGRKARKKV